MHYGQAQLSLCCLPCALQTGIHNRGASGKLPTELSQKPLVARATCPFWPRSWRGLRDDALVKASGIEGASDEFCKYTTICWSVSFCVGISYIKKLLNYLTACLRTARFKSSCLHVLTHMWSQQQYRQALHRSIDPFRYQVLSPLKRCGGVSTLHVILVDHL